MRQEIVFEPDVIVDGAVKELTKFFKIAGKKKAIIGISGGIDSAVCAWLCCRALGMENVTGVSMPSKYSSKGSVTDAKALADSLGFDYGRFPIRDLHEAFLNSWPLESSMISGKPHRFADENVQARIRGVMLMTYSNIINGLVINTGNKTESLMGYCTLYGDTCGAVSPIGGLYKTEVYHLVKEVINKDGEVIPYDIVDKAPSAELSEGQRDEDDLPASYPILDSILISYKEHRLKHHQVVELAQHIIPAEEVKKILETVDRMEFKRNQSPPVLKL